nr:immunoglobulin heavy chain junction region [Macaca mulatta]
CARDLLDRPLDSW